MQHQPLAEATLTIARCLVSIAVPLQPSLTLQRQPLTETHAKSCKVSRFHCCTLAALTHFVHHGMIYVPPGYTMPGGAQFR